MTYPVSDWFCASARVRLYGCLEGLGVARVACARVTHPPLLQRRTVPINLVPVRVGGDAPGPGLGAGIAGAGAGAPGTPLAHFTLLSWRR